MKILSFRRFQHLYKILVIFIFIFLSTSNASAQNPLTLGDIMTGLRSKSSGMTLAEKNEKIKQWVEEGGITFDLTVDIRNELKQAGATYELLATIASAKVYKPSAVINKVTYDRNHKKDDKLGILFHIDFDITNRKEQYSHATVWISYGGKSLTQESNYFTPPYGVSHYSDLKIFIPYSDIKVEDGVRYTLEVSAGIHTDNHLSLAQWTGAYEICMGCSK
jgi:hypothetical protein